MEKIGVGIITFNRPEYYKQVLAAIPKDRIDALVVINDGENVYADEKDANVVIHNKTQLGIAKCKNKALKELIDFGCEHLFLIEDDVIIKNPEVFDVYIKHAKTFGIHHLNFLKVAGNEKTLKYTYNAPNGCSLGFYHNPQGAFGYFRKAIVKKMGYFDEKYKNAFEHIDYEYHLAKNSVAPPFWYNPDVLKSEDYLYTIDGSDQNSTITGKELYQENWNMSAEAFVEKWGHFTNQIPDVGQEELEKKLIFLETNYSQKKDTNKGKKLSVIIPYRDRKQALDTLIPALHEYLLKQTDQFNISVIEQDNKKPFNKGLMNNIGFLLNQESDYYCFHDVDLVPEFSDYSYPQTPSHLSAFCSQFAYINIPDKIMGGVILFQKEHYRKVNGYSNSYVGWGKEDDDLYHRCVISGLDPYKHPFGRYYSIPHPHRLSDPEENQRHEKNGKRFNAFQKGEIDYQIDGVNNIDIGKVPVIVKRNKLYSHYKIKI